MKQNRSAAPEGYYSEEEVAGMMGMAIPTLRSKHSRRKDLPPKTKTGGRIIYSINSFKKWLEGKEVPTPEIVARRSR